MLPSCVSASTELSRRHEIDWRLFGHSCTIAWFDGHTYIRSTTSTSYVDIFRSPRRPSCSTPLDAALPPRSWPRTSQTAAAPMNLLRPASLPLPRQRLYFLRRSSCGTTSCYFESCYYFRCVERYIIVVIFVIPLCPTICLSVSRSKRRAFRTGTVYKRHS